MAGKHSNKTNKGIRFRLGVLILIFAVLSFVIVAGRLLYLQVINTNFYQSKAGGKSDQRPDYHADARFDL